MTTFLRVLAGAAYVLLVPVALLIGILLTCIKIPLGGFVTQAAGDDLNPANGFKLIDSIRRYAWCRGSKSTPPA